MVDPNNEALAREVELLPCPFCGGRAHRETKTLPEMDYVETNYICCYYCGTRKATVDKWNTRAALDAKDAQQKELPNDGHITGAPKGDAASRDKPGETGTQPSPDRLTLVKHLERLAEYHELAKYYETCDTMRQAAQALRQSADREVPVLPENCFSLELSIASDGSWTVAIRRINKFATIYSEGPTINAACKAAIARLEEEK